MDSRPGDEDREAERDQDRKEAAAEARERQRRDRCQCENLPGRYCPGPDACPYASLDDEADDSEHCASCGAALEESQIGLCDDCQQDAAED